MKLDINFKITWADLKARISAKNMQMQYVEHSNFYVVFGLENGNAIYTHIAKTSPANADQTDFESNYKSSANTKVLDVVAAPESLYQMVPATNGSNENANVNGGTTPQTFRWSAPVGQRWNLENITFYLNDNANFSNTGFAGIGALTNGIQFNIRSNGVVQTLCVVNNNYDVIKYFIDQVFSSVATGLLSTDRTYRGSINFKNRITLDGDDGDYFEMVIRDNITGTTGVFLNGLVWRLSG